MRPLEYDLAPEPASTLLCRHCGTAFRSTANETEFCCAGCHFVYDLIHKHSLEQFYELRERDAQPVKSLVFQRRDYSWLEDLVKAAESSDARLASLALDLQGISCIGCVWLVEKLFAEMDGAVRIRVDHTLGRMDLSWLPGRFDVIAFARQIQSFGYLVGPVIEGRKRGDRGLIVRIGLCGALALNNMLFTIPAYVGLETNSNYTPLFARFAMGLSTLSFLVGGSYFTHRSWQSLRRGVLHIDLPISLGLIAAYICSIYAWIRGTNGFVYFDFVSNFTFLMLVGRWLQQRAVSQNRNLLLSAQSYGAHVLRAGSEEKLPVEQIVAGSQFLVAPGQPVPVRAKLRSVGAALGLEWINGESETVSAPRGRLIASGAINCGACAIELEALENWNDSLLSRLTKVAAAPEHRNLALERFIRDYLVVVLALGGAALAVWWWKSGDFLVALQIFTSVLVVSCPCAAGVALPFADDLAASALRRAGVFIREGSLWPRLERIRKIIFDKTGTLTLETMILRNPEALAALGDAEKSALLAMIEENQHPVSCCLREVLLSEGVIAAALPSATEQIGYGLECVDGERRWRLGRRGWAGDASGDCLFSRDGRVLAAFQFGENVRSDAAEEVADFQKKGHEVYILSGDRKEKVAAMSRRLGLPIQQCESEMSPQGKAEWVSRCDQRDTLLIGDGANDSLAFDRAFCTGTPAIDRGLLERKADFYFLGRGLAGIRRLFEIAAARRRAVRSVVGFALLYNIVAISVCLAGAMSPVAAAILMPLSSLVSLAIVVISLRNVSQGSRVGS